MKIAYIDASAGIAGDMLMAALVDAGADPEAAHSAIDALGLPGVRVQFTSVRRAGLRALYADVQSSAHDHTHRHASEVLSILKDAPLSHAVKACAIAVFEHLINAETAAHGTAEPDTHLHEVGADDSLADVVAVAALLDDLGLLVQDGLIICSPIAAGSGTVRSAHGVIPVPVPAVTQILLGSDLALDFSGLDGERTTPTGAALLRVLATSAALPPVRVQGVGVGAGRRDTSDRPNVVRVVLGDTDPDAPPSAVDGIEVLECTVDDLDPQFWPGILQSLREAGALDCWTTRITGRHGRPGEVVTVLTTPALREALTSELFAHTGTFGVRRSVWRRDTLERRTELLPMANGVVVEVKLGTRAGRLVTAKPEPAQLFSAAQALGIPVRAMREAVVVEMQRRWRELAAPPTVADPHDGD